MGGRSHFRTRALLQWGAVGNLAPAVSHHPLRWQTQWGAHVQSWAQVEAGGSPGQRVEAALEAQGVSGLAEELTRFLVQTLKNIFEKNQSINQPILYALQSAFSCPNCW